MATLLVVLLIAAVALGLLYGGYRIACDELCEDRAAVEQQRQALEVEWQALENSRRINDVFFQARQAMRSAERDGRS